MKIDVVQADELINVLASKANIDVDPAVVQNYYDMLAQLGYPRSTTPIARESNVLSACNQWAKSTGSDLKFIKVYNYDRYLDKQDQHFEWTITVTPQQNEQLYAINKDNAMDSEVLVSGYGRMNYNTLMKKVAGKFHELGNMLDSGDPSVVKQVKWILDNDPLVPMVKALDDAFGEISAMRKRGGRGSRGIGPEFKESTEEDIYNTLKEKWSEKYKRSIDCNDPRGFSQKAHCAGKKKR